ncbi:MAG: DUF4271 domain-containing protein [Paludibacteraceae bacterium]|nr:DUF4271 domain-containing protein [Paludibacteraceae bacterium]
MQSLPMIERATTWADLPFVGIVLMVLCAAIICSYNMARNYHRELLRNFFRDKDRFAYADYSNSLLSSILLIVCTIIIYGFFFTIVNSHFTPAITQSDYWWVLLIMIGVVVVWVVYQWLLLKATGYCANIGTTMPILVRSLFVSFVISGLLLYPIVVGLVFASQVLFTPLIYIGLCIVIISVLLFVARAIQLFLSGIDTACYLFLYLCTLEILPVLLLQKTTEMVVENVLN